MSDDIMQLWETIRATLDEMGKEACAEGRPYGLRCYGSYCRKKLRGSFREGLCEEPITEGLARKLCGKSINEKTIYALPERQYPNKKWCDVVIWLNEVNFLWIECKAAYKEHLDGTNDDNYDYNVERPCKPGSWRATVEGTNGHGGISNDVEKLRTLIGLSPVTCYIGVLLLGFDRQETPIAVDELYPLLPEELKTQWIPAHGEGNREGIIRPEWYLPRANEGFRERVWFWYRAVNET